MLTAQFNFPTTILYGPGSIQQLAARLAGETPRKYLIVTDAGLVKIGIIQRIEKAFAEHGLKTRVFAEVHPNPIEEDIEKGAKIFRDEKLEGIIGVGGGSPLDAAKAIAMLATHEGPYERYDATKGGHEKLVNAFPPIHAIPTTAGTGSEVGRSCVVIVRSTGRKCIGFHPRLLPKTATLDPELTVGLPPGLTAATGMDAFTHALEAYLSLGFNPPCDAIALGAMELVIANLPRAVSAGDDLDVRGRMLVAASMAATAFQKGLGLVHSLAHPLSTKYNAHHGLANAMLLEPTFAWQLEHKASAFTEDLKARYQRVTRLFPDRARASHRELPEALAAFRDSVGIDVKFADIGLVAADIPALATEAFDDPCHTENPIPVTRDDLAAIYQTCLDR